MSDKPIAEKRNKPSLKYLRDKDREMVKGIFRFHEVPGGEMRFSVKFYKEDPVENFALVDGQVYTIPLGVARHLNKNLWYPQYDYIPGDKATYGGFGPNTTMRVTRKVRRCSFQSLEFIDSDDIMPDTAGLSEVTSYTAL